MPLRTTHFIPSTESDLATAMADLVRLGPDPRDGWRPRLPWADLHRDATAQMATSINKDASTTWSQAEGSNDRTEHDHGLSPPEGDAKHTRRREENKSIEQLEPPAPSQSSDSDAGETSDTSIQFEPGRGQASQHVEADSRGGEYAIDDTFAYELELFGSQIEALEAHIKLLRAQHASLLLASKRHSRRK